MTNRLFRSCYLLATLIVLSFILTANRPLGGLFSSFPEPAKPTPWADSIFQTLTLDQRIAQLFMVASWSDPNHNSYNAPQVEQLIRNYGIGGVIFFQGFPGRQIQLTNKFQGASKVPLLIGIDGEWGLGMRLDSTIAYPRQMTLGAMADTNVTYAFGQEVARQMKRIGVHINFAPVVDINNNARNPVIGNRSFGEDRVRVAAHGSAYMRGMQDHGIIACAKHFPGHGDTQTDSHKDLPIIRHDLARLDSVELYPYKRLIAEGLGSVMTAHLYITALESSPIPSTLSRHVVHEQLRERLGFQGLIITDAMNMQGVAKYFKPGEMDVKALQAGNDILLFPADVPLAIQSIKNAIANGQLSEGEINEHCLRVLRAKEWCGVHQFKPISALKVSDELNSPQAFQARRRIVEESITVLKNDKTCIPLNCLHDKTVAVVACGEGSSVFENWMMHYGNFDAFTLSKNPDDSQRKRLLDTLKTYDIVVAAMTGSTNKMDGNYGMSNQAVQLLNEAGKQSQVITCLFANPYCLEGLKSLESHAGLMIAYQDDAMTQIAAAEVICGALPAHGRLPVTGSTLFPVGSGMDTKGGDKLRWSVDMAMLSDCLRASKGSISVRNNGQYEEDMMAEAEGQSTSHVLGALPKESTKVIDEIALSGISGKAYPGCRIVVVKRGSVVYDKSFGKLDWNDKHEVSEHTVYDLASISKIVSGTICAMKLVDLGLLDVNKKVGDYLSFTQGTPYAEVNIKQMLSHSAGFTAWIPFYTKTLKDGKPDSKIYRSASEPGFSVQVADHLFIMDSYRDTIWNRILREPISSDKSYKYSDLTFYFMQKIIESLTHQPLDEYVEEQFYMPLALTTMGYQPLKRLNKLEIAPTENDKTFRGSHLRGFVHDQGASMLGGVAGHAGVFSNSHDLAVIMQMLLNGGHYGGVNYLSPETIQLFNTRHIQGNRRGLGFDKQTFTPGQASCSKEATEGSFGHTGFTGTMCWVDPDHELVYIMLSNRVNPDMDNKRLMDLNIRTKIQSEIYRIWGNK
ncbi:MAG: glycoside hydrolase family 3 N-terminal domain-containing protein [Flavobacteriales bacterium]